MLLLFLLLLKFTLETDGYIVGSFNTLQECEDQVKPVYLTYERINQCVVNSWLNFSYSNTYSKNETMSWISERLYNDTECNDLTYSGDELIGSCFKEILFGQNWLASSTNAYLYTRKYATSNSYTEILYEKQDCEGSVLTVYMAPWGERGDCVPHPCLNEGENSYQSMCGRF